MRQLAAYLDECMAVRECRAMIRAATSTGGRARDQPHRWERRRYNKAPIFPAHNLRRLADGIRFRHDMLWRREWQGKRRQQALQGWRECLRRMRLLA